MMVPGSWIMDPKLRLDLRCHFKRSNQYLYRTKGHKAKHVNGTLEARSPEYDCQISMQNDQ